MIGYLGSGFLGTSEGSGGKHSVDAFRSGLKEMGFVEGQNVAIEFRFAENRPERLPELVADLVRRRVAVICTASNVTALAVKKATSEIAARVRRRTRPGSYGSCHNHEPAGGQRHRRVVPD